jgi:hypothetical protein
MRVCFKNTFLTIEEAPAPPARARALSAGASRSNVEIGVHGSLSQLTELNKLLGDNAHEDVTVWQTQPEDCDELVGGALRQNKPLCRKNLSHGSISTMASASDLCALPHVSSTDSVSTMASDQSSDENDTESEQEPCTTGAPPGVWTQGRSPAAALPKESKHCNVPKSVNLAEEYAKHGRQGAMTTIMIRNVPNRYSQRELINELKSLGFAGTFDFLYVPLDLGTMSNVGYAFVNFTDPAWAEKCMEVLQNHRFKRHRQAGKVAAVSAAHIQGLEANLKHYEKSAVNTSRLRQRRPVVIANMSSLFV